MFDQPRALVALAALSEAAGVSNEDVLGLRLPGAAWVIDGATASTSRAIEGKTAPEWYASELSAALTECRTIDARSWLKEALKRTLDRYRTLVPDDDIAPRPSAAIAAVKLDGNSLTTIALGDVMVMVWSNAADQVRQIHGGEVSSTEQEFESQLQELLAEGLPLDRARHQTLECVERRRQEKMNRDGGYWIASLVPEAADHALQYTTHVLPGDRVLLASDGFVAAERYGIVRDWASVMRGEPGLEFVYRETRQIEAADPDSRQFPRIKASDDATALLLEVAGDASRDG